MIETTRAVSIHTRRISARVGPAVLLAVVAACGAREARWRAVQPTLAAVRLGSSDSTFDKTLDASPGERIVLRLRSGGAVVLRSWDQPHVRLRALLRGRDWRGMRVSFERTTDGVQLESGSDRNVGGESTSNRFELWVPRKFNVALSSAGGGIRIDGVDGDITGHTGGGAIWIGSSSGMVEVETGGGDIELDRMVGDVRATTGAGSVTITVANTAPFVHSISIRSGSGRVLVALPARVDARFDIESAYTEQYGPTTIQSEFAMQTTQTTEWDATQGTPRKFVRSVGVSGGGRGLIQVRTVNGSVVIRKQ